MYLYIGARFLETDNILRSIVKETELYIKYVTVPDNYAGKCQICHNKKNHLSCFITTFVIRVNYLSGEAIKSYGKLIH